MRVAEENDEEAGGKGRGHAMGKPAGVSDDENESDRHAEVYMSYALSVSSGSKGILKRRRGAIGTGSNTKDAAGPRLEAEAGVVAMAQTTAAAAAADTRGGRRKVGHAAEAAAAALSAGAATGRGTGGTEENNGCCRVEGGEGGQERCTGKEAQGGLHLQQAAQPQLVKRRRLPTCLTQTVRGGRGVLGSQG
jgi:hypothetical protein